jgi:hypothetical protein
LAVVDAMQRADLIGIDDRIRRLSGDGMRQEQERKTKRKLIVELD